MYGSLLHRGNRKNDFMYNSDLYESFWITLKSSPKIAQPVKPVNHVKETGKSFIVEASLDILGLQHFCFQETRLWQAKYSTLGPVLYTVGQ